MSEEKSIQVTRSYDASVDALFDVLSNPRRHTEIDGSGFVRSGEHADRITANGQVFTMDMSGEHMGGDYRTDNHVTGYAENKLIAWKTAPEGTEPPGWEWVWELTPTGPDSADVTLTYDWSKVDAAFLEKISFPLVTEEQLEDSLANLASAVDA